MTTIDTTYEKRNVIILVIAQAFMGAQMPIIFLSAGLAGQSLAANVCWATLPISILVFGSMTTAPWLSPFMQRFGRKAGFTLGAFAGMIGAGISAYALFISSFEVFLIGSYFSGIYMSAQGFFRFAATDTASLAFKPKAISYVMAGGLMSAMIGPQIFKFSSEAFVIPFLGAYLAIILINIVGSFLFIFLKMPVLPTPKDRASAGRSLIELLKTPRITVAIICSMVAYSLMNLVMTSTPLAVVGCGFDTGTAADIVTGHILAMYVPSFFTGHLIARFGVRKIVTLGLVILTSAGFVALSGVELGNFYIALILLGIGWNFGYIGATTMLASAHAPEERGRIQGLNDFMVFGMVTVASLSSGGLMNCSGGDPVQGWTAVNIAMVPFLMLAFGALIWLFMHEDKARQ
jgi:MFS family permease